jgi:hypothetical protein
MGPVFLCSIMLTIVLSYIAFIMLRCILHIPSFFRAFSIKCCWILSNTIKMIMWFLFLLLFICCIMFVDLYILNRLYIPRM